MHAFALNACGAQRPQVEVTTELLGCNVGPFADSSYRANTSIGWLPALISPSSSGDLLRAHCALSKALNKINQ
jgi:hypothetical protein